MLRRPVLVFVIALTIFLGEIFPPMILRCKGRCKPRCKGRGKSGFRTTGASLFAARPAGNVARHRPERRGPRSRVCVSFHRMSDFEWIPADIQPFAQAVQPDKRTVSNDRFFWRRFRFHDHAGPSHAALSGISGGIPGPVRCFRTLGRLLVAHACARSLCLEPNR